MTDYGLIIADIVIFATMLLVAFFVSNIFPGRVKETARNKGDTVQLQTKKTLRRLMQSAYILGMSLTLEMFLEVALEIIKIESLSEQYLHFFAVEETHYGAWILFWAAAFILYFVEYALRTYYSKSGKTAPISPLLSVILRTAALIAVALWIGKYVLDWHSTHILVSATAITAILGFTLKGLLGDLLSGVSLHVSHAVIPAQWIEVPSLRLTGEVLTTNWRETRLRTNSGHIYIVPNSTLARSHFHNLNWPDAHRRISLDFILSAENNPKDVEVALLAAVEGNPKVSFEPTPPKVAIAAYLEFGIKYQLRVWCDGYHQKGAITNMIYKAAWDQLQQRNIQFLDPSNYVGRVNI